VFLYLAFNAPHGASTFGDGTELSEKKKPEGVQAPEKYVAMYRGKVEDERFARYCGAVTCMDEAIGALMDALEKAGQTDNTIFLFMSDNGASSELLVRGGGHDAAAPAGSAATYLCLGPGWASVANTPLKRHKSWVHEGGIATPLIAHWPEGIQPRGLIRKGTGHLIDLTPTLLELAGLPSAPAKDEPAMHGRSLVRLLKSGEEPSPRSLWWLHEGNAAYRDGDWKIVRTRGKAWSLHHLPSDRAEKVDLAAREPTTLARLSAAWEAELQAHIRLAMPSTSQPSSEPSR
jgi:arylsulfatase